MMKSLIVLIITLTLFTQLNALEVQLGALLDSSIFEDNTDNSSSIGDFIFVGTTGDRNGAGPSFRRGLIQFDIAENLPTNIIINSVSLTLTIGRVPDEKFVGTTQTLHRVTTEWGATETALLDSDFSQGNGVPAQDGEATWNEAIRGTNSWITPGGDFVSSESASIGISPIINQAVTWTNVGMVNDVEQWLANPGSNFGWMLIGNESFIKNARGYYSMDNSDPSANGLAPRLNIDYTLVPEPKTYTLLVSLFVLCILTQRRQPRFC
ncbi:MAG: DNRLRE domain-containing protein [Opitutaceae bacterium]